VISDILTDLKSLCSKDVDLIVQPVSPMSKWSDKKHLFEISELIGAHFNVSIIPQIHKYMDID